MLKKSTVVTLLIFFVAIPLTLYFGGKIPGRGYYVTSTLVILEMLLPFFMVTDSLFLIPELEGNPFTYSGAEKLLPLVGKLFLLLIAPVPILLWYGSLGKESMAPLMVGFFTGGVYLFWQSLRDSMALGQLTNLERWPLLRTLSLASAGPGLERVEYLGLMVLVGGGLFVAAALVSAAKEMIEAI